MANLYCKNIDKFFDLFCDCWDFTKYSRGGGGVAQGVELSFWLRIGLV